MIIREYDKALKPILSEMMVSYMTELDCGIPEEIIRGKLSDHIEHQYDAGIIRICLAIADNHPVAFSIFQLDQENSDWCKRPGWGFIREYYVIPPFRKSGIGKALADYTVCELRRMGANHFYLTSSGAIPFWQKCGWKLTEEICRNGQPILEKE